jgi:hypothetical protein
MIANCCGEGLGVCDAATSGARDASADAARDDAPTPTGCNCTIRDRRRATILPDVLAALLAAAMKRCRRRASRPRRAA